MGYPLDNEGLQAAYDEMHKRGASAWFSDGWEERELILKMGEPWKDTHTMEIGCGEGDLVAMIKEAGGFCFGIDYSQEAIAKAQKKYPRFDFYEANYNELGPSGYDRIVMQGVLEHLDDPFGELQWMIEHFKPDTVITSSPCFLNPRGIVWMTLDMLGAVMSKTDLHYLNRWQFEDFCLLNGYKLKMESCDWSWGNDVDMISDLSKRIPLALKDGNLAYDKEKLDKLLMWLHNTGLNCDLGATMVYRIDL